jgi:hypothetical protein
MWAGHIWGIELRDKRVAHEGTRAKVAEALKRLG